MVADLTNAVAHLPKDITAKIRDYEAGSITAAPSSGACTV